MAELKTIKIKHEDGYRVINECDFRDGVDEMFESIDTTDAEAKAAEKAEAKAKAAAEKAEAKAKAAAEKANAPAERNRLPDEDPS